MRATASYNLLVAMNQSSLINPEAFTALAEDEQEDDDA